ncbi:MAG: hypothetical protein CMJ64_26920 [Planctomycetaceae bacterium]|nr:hypothetical protein [Planctomycetaceae bacterium]
MKSIRVWAREVIAAWDRFWYNAAPPHTLAMIRIFAGAMLLYTHTVWSKDLLAFLGPNSWIDNDASRVMHEGSFAWSYLWYVESPALLWTLHIAALVVFAMLTVGLFSRVVSVLAFIITISYCYRLEGALFGLDQVNAMFAMYLMLGPCGAVYSVDRWLARRRAGGTLPPPTIGANVAIRLLQWHMCILYLFAGVSKMRGDTWWDGSAFWFGVVNLEYQSLDITWLGRSPVLLSLVTHVTVFWETFYCVLIWPKLTRPIFLLLAVVVHGGIALCLGMITFGTAMLIGNFAFVAPTTVDALVAGSLKRLRRVLNRRLPVETASGERRVRQAD